VPSERASGAEKNARRRVGHEVVKLLVDKQLGDRDAGVA
jgi:hypothetical protein